MKKIGSVGVGEVFAKRGSYSMSNIENSLHISFTYVLDNKFVFFVDSFLNEEIKSDDFSLSNGKKKKIPLDAVVESTIYGKKVSVHLDALSLVGEGKWDLYYQRNPIVLLDDRLSKQFYSIGIFVNPLKQIEIMTNRSKHVLFTIKNMEQQQKDHVQGRVPCFHLEQHNEKISFCISKGIVTNIENVKLCVRKRKESVFFDLEHTFTEVDDFYCLQLSLEQFQDIYKKKSRLDLFLTEGEQTPRRIFCPYVGPSILQDAYLDIFDLQEQFSICCYRAKNNGVSFIISARQGILNESFNRKANLKDIHFHKNGKVVLRIQIEDKDGMEIESLVLKRRKSINNEMMAFLPLEIRKKKKQIELLFIIEIKKVEWSQFFWDAFLKVKNVNNHEIYLRIKNNHLRNKIKLQYTHRACEMDDGHVVYPYITISEELSFDYRPKGVYETTKYKWNERIAVLLYLLFGWIYRLQNIWLVHEKFSETAQDNGFYFFKYTYEHHRKRKAYFVIKKDSPDYRYVEHMKDRVVYFMSIKHLFLLLVCSKIIASESKGHAYAWRVSRGWIKPAINQKPFVFLQHGVLGLKVIDNTFNANGMNHANLFVVSSNFEKDIVMRHLGYSSKEVIVTGLARWDNLHHRKKEIQGEKNILFMPTWRNWLEEVTDDVFLDSEYFRQYSSLINSHHLNEWLTKNHMVLNFYIHPKFSQFLSHFQTKSNRIQTIFFGEQPLNHLLMNANLLITDYSSVAFEAFYQEKATLFFQFDRKQYLELQGSYLDLERDLFGPSACNENELLTVLDDMYKTGFTIQEEYLQLKEHYFQYCDDHDSERIYHSIIQWEKKRTWNQSLMYYLKRNPIVRTLWRKVRKNSFLHMNGN